MLRERISIWCGTLAVALTVVSPATAQSDAPQVDPDSPAGTEYQLPIDRAREQAGGGASSVNGGETPLFGEGVERGKPDSAGRPNSAGKPDSAGRPNSAGKPGAGSGNGNGTPTTTVESGPSTPVIVRTAAADGGGSGSAAVGAGAAGVLLIGGLAGLFWRRRAGA